MSFLYVLMHLLLRIQQGYYLSFRCDDKSQTVTKDV